MSLNSEDVVDDGGNSLDVFSDQVSGLNFQIVNGKSGGVEDILCKKSIIKILVCEIFCKSERNSSC